MKKLILIIIIFLLSSNLFPENYKNPFWDNNYFDLIRINNNQFKPDYIIINTSIPFDSIRGIYTGVFYELESEINFSKYLSFSNKLRLGENIPRLKIVDLGSGFYPFSFLKSYFDYRYRDFSKYKIGEHNLILTSEINVNSLKYLSFSFIPGVNFRFIDLNINDNKAEYKKDWLFSSFFLWSLKLMFHPVFVYSFGFSLGNIDEYEIFTINYWQFEFINYFHLPKNISIFANGGFAYAGSFPFAGIINRFWVRIGVRYEIKFH